MFGSIRVEHLFFVLLYTENKTVANENKNKSKKTPQKFAQIAIEAYLCIAFGKNDNSRP